MQTTLLGRLRRLAALPEREEDHEGAATGAVLKLQRALTLLRRPSLSAAPAAAAPSADSVPATDAFPLSADEVVALEIEIERQLAEVEVPPAPPAAPATRPPMSENDAATRLQRWYKRILMDRESQFEELVEDLRVFRKYAAQVIEQAWIEHKERRSQAAVMAIRGRD
mmetsp:Transcript_30703/g.71745  ORF Transcript_30703/g.71745 Transcript_30703/m.71745 type:complete len:168 (-) Transcript_30703:347-850(-)